MDINKMVVFYKVAELQSFTKAANVLGMEKSKVSNRISSLEKEVGFRLLNRTPRSVTLTDHGSEFLEICKNAVDVADQANEFKQGLSSKPEGIIRITTTMGIGLSLINDIFPAFQEKYPEIIIDLTTSNRDVDIIKEQYDFAFRITQQNLVDSTLIAKPLIKNNTVHLYASPEYLARKGQPEDIAELDDHDFIMLAGNRPLNKDLKLSLETEKQSYKINAQWSVRVNDMYASKCAVMAGLGIGMMPAVMSKEEIKTGKLKLIFPEITLMAPSLYLVYPNKKNITAKTQAFVDFIDEWKTNPYGIWDEK